MKIGVVGAGFTGLTAAYYLAKKGHEVIVFEKEAKPGGLAIGFKEEGWKWPLEKHYHHIFISDDAIRNLASEVGREIIFRRPITSIYINGMSYQFDSAVSLLGFRELGLLDRLRVGGVLFCLRFIPFWKPLEKMTARKFLKKWMGEKGWKVLWQPLFEKKFGRFAKRIPAAWFWARINKRSSRLGYPKGGFESLAVSIEKETKRLSSKFLYKTEVTNISKERNVIHIQTKDGNLFFFDKVVCTLPSTYFLKVTKGLPVVYKNKLSRLKGLGAVNLVLSLKRKFLTDGTYWLNVNEKDSPFIGIMEQTNFMNPGFYRGERIIYVGNYLETNHRYFNLNANELLSEFFPYLRKINPNFSREWVKKAFVFKAPFAQPVIPLNYSRLLPSFKTPIEGVFLANIQQVYPWDRGTNYAVELGEKVAKLIYTSRAE